MKKKVKKDQSEGLDRRTFLKAGAVGVGAVAALGASQSTSAQTKYSGEKIDLFCHILPPKYNEAFVNKAVRGYNYQANSKLSANIQFGSKLVPAGERSRSFSLIDAGL